ncbi:hypothetical protein IDH32_02760 [Pelagibacterales bacterium SAG-MED01]|nr:hypothetical protein [Pelagibacterales bacterium SAG-MED01]
MKKIILRFIFLITSILILIVGYLTFIGVETKKFNNQISSKIKNINENLEIELNDVKIILDPLKLRINVKTVGPILKNKDKFIELESIKTQISINSFINDEFLLTNLIISTKSLEIKNLISFVRSLKKSTELYIFERFLKKGYLIADIKLEFNSNGKIKDNFVIKGIVKDTQVDLFKKYNFKKLSLIFNVEKQSYKFKDIKLSFNDIPLTSNNLFIKGVNDYFYVKGEIKNKDIKLDKDKIELFTKFFVDQINIKDLNFNSDNNFSFNIDKKFKIKDFQISSEIRLNDFLLLNNLELEKIFPKAKQEISFSDHLLKVNYTKKLLNIEGIGKVLLQDEHDVISYSINKNGESYKFQTSLEVSNNPFIVDLLNFEKDKNSKMIIKINGEHFLRKKTKLNKIYLTEKENEIKLNNLVLNKTFKVESLKSINFDYFDKNNKKNKFSITKKKSDYFVNGSSFNADNLIENIVSDNENKSNIFNKNFNVFFKIDHIYLDDEHEVKNLNGNLYLKDNEILNANLKALFSKNQRLNFTINSDQEGKITTLFLSKAEPIIKKYKFIKGYEGGSLDFYSSKKGNKSISTLKIYDFKLKELPALTKLLTLASLQGIADILSGEGIRFDEFEMNFENEGSLMTIKEIYAIGPAISILMDGYVEKNKTVSLRGTLVPATTINKAIGSIPVLGKILVGSKSGEGVFGVSFKIKGPPKDLQTTVNPIKTLTPRFITRTLEKIKKN